jgi:hypothetical protein
MEFLKNFYNSDVTGGKLVSERVLEANQECQVRGVEGPMACCGLMQSKSTSSS